MRAFSLRLGESQEEVTVWLPLREGKSSDEADSRFGAMGHRNLGREMEVVGQGARLGELEVPALSDPSASDQLTELGCHLEAYRVLGCDTWVVSE